MNIDWEPIRPILENNNSFVLSSHVRPDADALGSELAVAALLEAMGKSVRIVNPSATPDHLLFLDPEGLVQKLGDGNSPEELMKTDVHMVLDTSAWAQLQGIGDILKRTQAQKVVIDHHVSSDDLGAVEFKDTTAEATGSIIYHMATSLGYELPEKAATPLYAAIATDTGWFRFPSTTSQTMRTAGDLIDLGARPHLIYQLLYEQYSLARIRLTGRVLSRVTVSDDGKLAYTWVSQTDFKETNSRPVDTEDLVNECLRIEGTRGAFIAIEQMNQRIKVSFRSRTDLNVAKVAEEFGGGGHKQAAGAVLPGPLEVARDRVKSAMLAALAE
ncbi:MAG: DHHA1 domain-containing protein [Planctomycetaceae bacterium]